MRWDGYAVMSIIAYRENRRDAAGYPSNKRSGTSKAHNKMRFGSAGPFGYHFVLTTAPIFKELLLKEHGHIAHHKDKQN